MGDTYNIHDNQFHDSSVAVKNISYTKDENMDGIRDELIEIQKELNKEGDLYRAITDLLEAINKKNNSDIRTAIGKNIKEFTKPLFTKVASQKLLEMVERFHILT